ncbi:hypothetical protein F4679DRAFT_267758 [Xylaria curta]|nr:hypothetical protein F4679DRAFT_267758 [Xylaria curta]
MCWAHGFDPIWPAIHKLDKAGDSRTHAGAGLLCNGWLIILFFFFFVGGGAHPVVQRLDLFNTQSSYYFFHISCLTSVYGFGGFLPSPTYCTTGSFSGYGIYCTFSPFRLHTSSSLFSALGGALV